MDKQVKAEPTTIELHLFYGNEKLEMTKINMLKIYNNSLIKNNSNQQSYSLVR